jgi:hypothetical protein
MIMNSFALDALTCGYSRDAIIGGELNVSTSDLTNDPLPPAKAHSASVGRV